MSDGNKREVRYIEEVTWGTTPGSGNLIVLPYVSGSFGPEIQSLRSRTVRADAQLSAASKSGEQARGSLEFEFAPNQFDELLKGAIRSDANWTTAVSATASDVSVIGATANGGTYSSTSVINFTTNLSVGQWLYVSGFASAVNNGWKKIVSSTLGPPSTTTVTGGGAMVNVGSGVPVTFKSAQIRNGSALRHFSMQQQATDLTNKYKTIVGARMTEFGLSADPYGLITGNVAFTGKQFATASASFAGTTPTAAASTNVQPEASSIDTFWRDLTQISTYDVYGLRLRLAAAARPAKKLGGVALTSLNQNAFEATGSLTLYEVDNTTSWLADLQNGTKFGFAFSFGDSTGRYHVELPNVLLTQEPGRIPGLDQDVQLAFDFAAEPGSSINKTIQICRAL